MAKKFCSFWRSRPIEHETTYHGEAWTVNFFHVLSFDPIDFTKIGSWVCVELGGHLEIVLLDFADRAFSRDALDIAVRLITMTSHNRALSLLQNKIEMSRVDYNRDENKESLSAPLVQLLPSSSIFHGANKEP